MKVWLTGIVLVLLGVAAWYFFNMQQDPAESQVVAVQPMKPPPPAVSQEVVPEFQPEPVIIPEKAVPSAPELAKIPLPPLNESDPLAKDTLSGLFGEAEVLRYFVSEDIVARAVANIDALGSRQVPEPIQAVRGPQDSFIAMPDSQPATIIRNEMGDPLPQFLSDPENDQRYTAYVEMLESMDTETLLSLYRRNYPLLEDAYRQLGYPDGDFNERLKAVIDELLATPDIDEPLHLVKPEAFYLFTDEELEALPAGQKIMVRMGKNNSERVKSKLSEIRESL